MLRQAEQNFCGVEAQWNLGLDSHLIDAQLGFLSEGRPHSHLMDAQLGFFVRRSPAQPFDEGSARIFVRASPGQTEDSENSEIQRLERTGRKARKNEGSMSSRCAVEGVCKDLYRPKIHRSLMRRGWSSLWPREINSREHKMSLPYIRSAYTPWCVRAIRGLLMPPPCRDPCVHDGSRPGSAVADDDGRR